MKGFILRLTGLLLFAPLAAIAAGVPDDLDQLTTISEIKAHPMQYDGKLIRVAGWLASGHLGVSLYEEDHCSSLHVRPPDEVRLPKDINVQKDKRFDEFWRATDRELLPYKGPRVEIEALVRVLKKDGKPAKRFYIYGQFPIELIPIRVGALNPVSVHSPAQRPTSDPCAAENRGTERKPQ